MYHPLMNAAMRYRGSIHAKETKKDVTANPISASGKKVVAPQRKR
jgi:hypothetical protein